MCCCICLLHTEEHVEHTLSHSRLAWKIGKVTCSDKSTWCKETQPILLALDGCWQTPQCIFCCDPFPAVDSLKCSQANSSMHISTSIIFDSYTIQWTRQVIKQCVFRWPSDRRICPGLSGPKPDSLLRFGIHIMTCGRQECTRSMFGLRERERDWFPRQLTERLELRYSTLRWIQKVELVDDETKKRR